MANQEECIHINATERSPSSQHISPLSPSSPPPILEPPHPVPFQHSLLCHCHWLILKTFPRGRFEFCSSFSDALVLNVDSGEFWLKKANYRELLWVERYWERSYGRFLFFFFWDVSREMFERMIDFRLYKLLFCLY